MNIPDKEFRDRVFAGAAAKFARPVAVPLRAMIVDQRSFHRRVGRYLTELPIDVQGPEMDRLYGPVEASEQALYRAIFAGDPDAMRTAIDRCRAAYAAVTR